MKKKNIRKLVLVCSALCATFFSGALMLANTSATSDVNKAISTFDLQYGASVRVVSDSKTSNGLKYTVAMPKTQYEVLKTAYSDVTFGVLIAPDEWLIEGYELTEENVFGANACYGFATWDGSKWVYDGDKPQIVNLTSTTMTEWSEDKSVVVYGGAMVNILDGTFGDGTNNLTREFRGVGYLSYTNNEQTEYVFVGDDDNVRSMTWIAQMAIADTTSDLTADEKDWLQEYYVDPVTDTATTYQVAHYVENAAGEYVWKETETLDGVTVDDAATATPKDFYGYTYNAAKSTVSGTVYPNGRLCLSVYYDRNGADTTADLGLIDRSTQTTLDLSEYAAYANTCELSLVSSGEKVAATITDNALSVTELNGAYALRLASDTGVAELTFDVYDKTADVEWNTLTESVGRISARDEYTALTATSLTVEDGAYTVQSNGTEAFAFGMLGLHSSAYYAQYADIGMELTFDYYVSAQQGDGATTAIEYAHVAFADDELWSEVKVDTWHTAKVSIEAIIDNVGAVLMETDSKFYQSVSVSEEWGGLGTLTYEGAGGAVAGDNACTGATWSFKNFALAQDITSIQPIEADETMLDMNGISNPTLESLLLTSEQQNTFATYATLGDIVWTLDGATVSNDASDIEGYYLVEATLTCGEQSAVVYTGNIDFYDSADGMVWQRADSLNLNNLFVKDYNDGGCTGITQEVVTTDLPSGANASTYYKIHNPQQVETAAGGTWIGWSASVTALHSKAYYDAWVKKSAENGFELQVTYDFYMTATGNGSAYGALAARNAYNLKGAVGKATSKWDTETMPFSTVAEDDVDMMSKWSYHGNATHTVYTHNMLYIEDACYYGCELTVYMGNFRTVLVSSSSLDYTDTVELTDLKDKETFDLTELISEEDKTTLGDISGYTWYLNGEEVANPVSTANLEGVYEVALGFEVYPYASTVYKAKIDFYNSEDGMVWQSADSLTLDDLVVKSIGNCVDLTYSLETENLPEGATAGKYYKISNPAQASGSMGWSASVTALHSKEYYEAWQTKVGASLQVKFDFYYVSDAINGWCAFRNNYNLNDAIQRAEGTWITQTLTFSKMMEKWDYHAATQHTLYSHNMVYAEDTCYYGRDLTIYIGNFRTEFVSGDAIDHTDTVTLQDLKDTETFDLSTLISADDMTTLGDISGYTWYLNGEEVTNPVSTENLEGVYEVSLGFEVYPYAASVWKAKVDFYDSNDGMVWQRADSLSLEHLHVKNEKNCVGITEELVTPEGKDGTYYKVYNPQQDSAGQGFSISVSALHSKEYYALWADSDTQKWVVEYDVCAEIYLDGALKSNSFQYQFKWTSGTSGEGWVTFAVDLSVLIENWDNLSDDTVTGYYDNMIQNENAVYYGREHTMWMGNFNSKQVEVSAS